MYVICVRIYGCALYLYASCVVEKWAFSVPDDALCRNVVITLCASQYPLPTVNRRMDEWVEIDQLNLATLDTEAVGKDDKSDDKAR